MKARRGKIRKHLALFLAFAMIFTTFLGDMSVVKAEELTGTEPGYSEGVPEPREQPEAAEPEAPAEPQPEVMAEPEAPAEPAAPEVSVTPAAPAEPEQIPVDAEQAPADTVPAGAAEQVNTYAVRFNENDLTAGAVWVDGQQVDTMYFTKDVQEGSDFIFRVVPNEGWAVDTVRVNGIDVEKTGNPEEYIVRSVGAETEIAVQYVEAPQTEADGESDAEETEEAPAAVKGFLDAAAALPSADEVTKENAEEIGGQVNAVLDMWEALDEELAGREDAAEALEKVYAVYEAVLAVEGIENAGEYSEAQLPYTSTSGVTKSAFENAYNLGQSDTCYGIVKLNGEEETDSGTPNVWATGGWDGAVNVTGYNGVNITNSNPDVATASYTTDGGKLTVTFKPGTASGTTKISVGVDAKYPHYSLGTWNMELNFDYTVTNGTTSQSGTTLADITRSVTYDLTTDKAVWGKYSTFEGSYGERSSIGVGIVHDRTIRNYYYTYTYSFYAQEMLGISVGSYDKSIATVEAYEINSKAEADDVGNSNMKGVGIKVKGLKEGTTQVVVMPKFKIPTTDNGQSAYLITRTMPITVYIKVTGKKAEYNYELIYDANGGAAGEGEKALKTWSSKKVSSDASEDFTVQNTIPHYEGYTFKGWADTANAEKAQYQAGDTLTLYKENPTKTIYAVWEKNEPTPPGAPSRDDLYGILRGFVKVHDVKEIHDDKIYSTWNGTVDGHHEASIGNVYRKDGTYYCDVTLYGDVYAKMYSMEPSFGVGERHTLVTPGETQSITLKYDNSTGKWTSGKDKDTILVTFDVQCNTSLDIIKTAEATDKAGEVAAQPKAGDTVKYTITVTNTGKITAKDVTITDNLDLTKLEKAENGVTLTVDGEQKPVTEQNGKYAIGDLPAGSKAVLTIVTKVKDGVLVGTEIKNVASADCTNNEDEKGPSDEADVTVGGSPLDVSKTLTSGSTATVGDSQTETVTWEINITNNSNKDKTVKVSDLLSNGKNATVKDKDGNVIPENGEVMVPAGQTMTLTASYTVQKEDINTSLKNTVTVTDPDDPDDPKEDTEDGPSVVSPDRKVTIEYVTDQGEKLQDDKVVDPFKDGEPYDVENEIPEAIDKDSRHYIKEEVEGDVRGTIDGADVTVKVIYTLDDIGTNPDNPDQPDGTPDKYQRVVTFKAVNGTLDGEDKIVKVVVTLKKDGKDAEDGSAYLTSDQIPDAQPNTGYTGGTWTPAEPTTSYEIKDNTDFVITYDSQKRTITVFYVDGDGNELMPKYTEKKDYGDSYDVSDKLGEETYKDEETGNNYVKDHVEGDPTGDSITEDIEIRVVYELDNIGPNDGPDGIPDKYQAVVTYEAVNGILDGPVKAVVTLKNEDGENAKAEDGGVGHLTGAQIPSASPNEGYTGGTWTPGTPTVDYEIKGNTDFVITYVPEEPEDPTPEDPAPENPAPETPAPVDPTPTPGTVPVIPVTPVPTTFTPAPAPAPVTPAPAAVVPVADEEVPLAAPEVTVDEADDTVTRVADEAVPLAAGPHEHKCCILHFLILLLALIVELFYTKSMKKHQKKIFEARREITEYDIQHQSEAA